MSCVSSATATEYTTITSYTTSTSLSQSAGTNQGSVTTIVQQSCVATGTLSGSVTGCVSSAAVTQVNTIGGDATTAQVPVIVTVSITETLPTKTLYASCSAADSTQTQSPTTIQTTSTTSSALSVTTSVLVESTPPPSVITQASSTTLANGDVIATTVITTSTLPPSSIYVASTIANPSASASATSSTTTQSGSGTNVAPIVGGVIGGFVGLILIVSALWYLCRRRTSWDDVFERDDPRDEELEYPIAVRRERDRNRLDLGTEPKPYQYGLVGHVTPPPGSGYPPSIGEPTSAFYHPSFSTASSHSRNTSITPLLGAASAPGKVTRPSTAGSLQAAAQPTQRQPSASATSQSSTDPRTFSTVSNSSSAPLIDDSTGSPVSVVDRRVLQIINDAPLSPASSAAPASPVPASPVPASPAPTPSAPARSRKGASAPRPSAGVVQHTDAGQISGLDNTSNEPPPYSRV